jgi:hypothetical protein
LGQRKAYKIFFGVWNFSADKIWFGIFPFCIFVGQSKPSFDVNRLFFLILQERKLIYIKDCLPWALLIWLNIIIVGSIAMNPLWNSYEKVLFTNDGKFIIDDAFFHDQTVVILHKIWLDFLFLLLNLSQMKLMVGLIETRVWLGFFIRMFVCDCVKLFYLDWRLFTGGRCRWWKYKMFYDADQNRNHDKGQWDSQWCHCFVFSN